jgi:hypothetical protein
MKFLKEHRKVQRLEAALEAINARLKKQETQLQKVSAQIDVRKTAQATFNQVLIQSIAGQKSEIPRLCSE